MEHSGLLFQITKEATKAKVDWTEGVLFFHKNLTILEELNCKE